MLNQDFFNPTDEFVDRLVEVINGRFVIEIGCGRGTLLKKLISKDVAAIGIDPFVDKANINPLVMTKILPFDIQETIKFLSKIEREKVFIVARPCHSGFPQEYLNFFGDKSEMIYIGFAKNLELDFERDLSLVRFEEFPEHPDCDSVAILKNSLEFKLHGKREQDWLKVDDRVQELKGDISEELLNWFKQKSNSYSDIEQLAKKKIQEKYPGFTSKGSRMGGYWSEYEGSLLFSKDITGFRTVTLDTASFMVGGGHLANSIRVEDEEFFVLDKENKTYAICSPWDHREGRPDFANRSDLTWYGVRNDKRTINLEAALIWLKQSFEDLQKEYKEKTGLELKLRIDSGIKYEIKQYEKRR